jgi:hypothetical protein
VHPALKGNTVTVWTPPRVQRGLRAAKGKVCQGRVPTPLIDLAASVLPGSTSSKSHHFFRTPLRNVQRALINSYKIWLGNPLANPARLGTTLQKTSSNVSLFQSRYYRSRPKLIGVPQLVAALAVVLVAPLAVTLAVTLAAALAVALVVALVLALAAAPAVQIQSPSPTLA